MVTNTEKEGLQLKIIDFNVSKKFEQSNLNTQTGNFKYRAPEMLKDLEYSANIDIWGVGCCFHFMLTGEAPFDSQNSAKLADMIINDSVRQTPGILSWESKEFISQSLAKNPEERGNILSLRKLINYEE
jgi:serine/threonine protein kinase